MPIDAPSENRPVVVVLDANASVRSAAQAALRSLPARVLGYASAAEFLAALDEGLSPACLIADVALPDLPAVALLGELKARDRRIPTILLSGDSEIAGTVDAMRAGAITCIEKPYLARFLLAQVAPLIDDAQAGARRPGG